MQRVRFVVGPQFGEAGDFADQMPPQLQQIVYCGVACPELKEIVCPAQMGVNCFLRRFLHTQERCSDSQ
jgi:hypothetical protein